MTESSNTRKTIDVTLKTDNFDIIFTFLRTPFREHAYVTINIVSQQTYNPYRVESTQASTSKKWMMSFGDYLIQHIKNIKNNIYIPTEEFIGEGYLYRAHVTGGKLHENGDVILNLRFWVDAGIRERIWVGIEANIDAQEILRFYERIKR